MTTNRKLKKRAPSVLGLTMIDGQLRACHMTRTKSGREVVKAATATLTLDLLHPEPELVGREIKNHLDAAGIRERHCVVRVPPRWVMSQHTIVPELSPEDMASYLQIEAEKGFPVDPSHLQIARSFLRSSADTYITQLAVRKEQIEQVIAVLKAAGLKPVSFTLGLALLPEATAHAGAGRIVVTADQTVTIMVVVGGGIAAFRTCEANIESEAGEKIVNGTAVARELRITLGQLPAELRSEVKELHLTGESALVRHLAESLGEWAGSAELKVTRGDLPEKNLAAEMAERLAGNWLEGGAPELEFLPPRPNRWTVFMARYSSKRLATAGFAVAAAVVVFVAAFGWHEYRRWSLRKEWAGMQAQVTQLDKVQASIREFRPWYDVHFRALSVLRRVTDCFPDNGSVTAKSFEMHGTANTVVTISGTARDSASLLRVQEQLHKAREVEDLNLEQIRGKTPMQFTLTFRWKSGT